MSITSRINEMSSHIEQAYDELQGLGADLTNVNKNIENISMVLDDIYDSLPQVSGEGTSLTLDDTRVGKIKSTLKGNTSQDGTPTPSSPIPVNVVSGDNEINVVGKNLIKLKNGSNVSQGVTITINDNKATFVGTPTRAYVGSVDMPLNLKKGTYTFSSTNGVNSFFLWFKNQGGNVFSSVAIRPNPSTITLNEDAYSIQVGLEGLTVGTACNVETYFQLEKGSSATSYEPYQGNTYNIDLPVENLCDVILDSSISGDISYKTYTFKPNTQYTISTNTWVTSSSTANIFASAGTSFSPSSATNGVNGSRTITSDSNGKITIGYRNVNLSLDYSSGDYYVQIELGSKANSYTPYGTTPIELCKIGNYQDYFYKDSDKWYWHSEYIKLQLTGNLNWYASGNGKWWYTVDYQNSLPKENDGEIMSNCFVKGSWEKSTDQNKPYTICLGNNGNGLIGITQLSFNDVDEMKTFLNNNEVYAYARRKTPTNTEVTYQPLIDQLNELEKAMSKDGQTNISQVNNDLPFIISASALKEWSV